MTFEPHGEPSANILKATIAAEESRRLHVFLSRTNIWFEVQLKRPSLQRQLGVTGEEPASATERPGMDYVVSAGLVTLTPEQQAATTPESEPESSTLNDLPPVERPGMVYIPYWRAGTTQPSVWTTTCTITLTYDEFFNIQDRYNDTRHCLTNNISCSLGPVGPEEDGIYVRVGSRISHDSIPMSVNIQKPTVRLVGFGSVNMTFTRTEWCVLFHPRNLYLLHKAMDRVHE